MASAFGAFINYMDQPQIKGEFILETRQKIFSPMAGNLNFGVIGWCRQDSLAGENSNLIFPPLG